MGARKREQVAPAIPAPLMEASATYQALGYAIATATPAAITLTVGGAMNARAWRLVRTVGELAAARSSAASNSTALAIPGTVPARVPLWRAIATACALLEGLAIVRQPVVIITATPDGGAHIA